MKSDNIEFKNINQEKVDNNKLKEFNYSIVDGKLTRVPNPLYDPEYAKTVNQANIQVRQELINKEASRIEQGKGSVTFTGKAVLTAQTPQEYKEQTSAINDIYRRLTWIKDPVRRMSVAKKLYADNQQGFRPSKQARIKGWQRQKERAKLTPAYIRLSISEEKTRNIIEELRNRKGKDNFNHNSCLAVLYELSDIARKGKGWIYISQANLAKRLNLTRETVNIAIDYLKKVGLLISHKSHYCPNIIQLSETLISNAILKLLAAFSYGRSCLQMRDLTQKFNNYDYINSNNQKENVSESLNVESKSSNVENLEINQKGLKFLQDTLKKLNICTPGFSF